MYKKSFVYSTTHIHVYVFSTIGNCDNNERQMRNLCYFPNSRAFHCSSYCVITVDQVTSQQLSMLKLIISEGMPAGSNRDKI